MQQTQEGSGGCIQFRHPTTVPRRRPAVHSGLVGESTMADH
ncbi:hypothetical protein [Alloactinosynnema sp. L-07]|nr:hypothetical protein [Alloactinosynnema sp. L-07]